LQKHLIVDLVGQIADEDVEVVRRVLLVGIVGLVGPVDADFLYQGGHISMDGPEQDGEGGLQAYRLMDAAAVQGLHGALSGTGIVVLNETVIVALLLIIRISQKSWTRQGGKVEETEAPRPPVVHQNITHILVRNNLNALDVAGGFEDLAKDVLGDAGIQATNV
jgi:hypothetical protein